MYIRDCDGTSTFVPCTCRKPSPHAYPAVILRTSYFLVDTGTAHPQAAGSAALSIITCDSCAIQFALAAYPITSDDLWSSLRSMRIIMIIDVWLHAVMLR